ncbi:ABC transporter ATP-binding protein [Vagococcus sp. BWB3-3]|uniref:ABC transporter ATP-binding protein n=1 Tax=Vagococcus allomyrinae TaxID=2794353 RepID=A0A940SW56_9ENTE|nr:ABC transporter ATP-binding protein [Vagococcus allomyrinae]MBP1041726.1 ABC transporter ATP-binding protein [Vagococcus allomyrinae]
MEKRHYRLRDNIKWYFKRVWHEYPQYYFVSLLGIILKAGQSLLTVLLPATLVDLLINQVSLNRTIVIVASMGLGLALINTLRQYIETKILLFALGVRTNLQLVLFEKSLTMDYQLMENAKVREIKHIAEVEGIDQNSSAGEAFATQSYYLVEVTVSFILFGMTLSFFHPLLFVLIIGTTIISFMSLKRVRTFREEHKDDWGKIDAKRHYLKKNAYAIENGKDIRLYEMNTWYDKHIEKANDERLGWTKKESKTVFISQFIQDTGVFFRNLVAYMLLVSSIIKGSLTLPQFTLFFTVLNSVTDYVSKIAEHSHLVLKANQGLNDIRHFTELKSQLLRLEPGSKPDSQGLDGASSLSIRFENVSFIYSGASDYTIKNLSFTINNGENVALVGVNGAGKSTIVKLISGLLQPTSGNIFVNGIDIKTIPIELFYQLVAPVFQESLIFAFDVAANVTMTDDYDTSKLNHCLEEAGIAAKIKSLPEGILTQMKQYLREDGLELSGGETQKLMIARALYKDAPILILDEPTAALDAIAESELYEKYNELANHKTSIFISHRLASTRFCQKILFLSDGKIIEEGSHDQLMALSGKYAEIYNVQSHYYQKEVV